MMPSLAGVRLLRALCASSMVIIAMLVAPALARGDASSNAFAFFVLAAGDNIETDAEPDLPSLGPSPLALTARAKVTGRTGPPADQDAGAVVFTLYEPSAVPCDNAAEVYTETIAYPSTESGFVETQPYPVTKAGTYHWTSSYADANNSGPDFDDACVTLGASTEVARATTTLATTAPATVALGPAMPSLTVSATVNGRVNPINPSTATLDFSLYAPLANGDPDATCAAAPVFETLNVLYPVAGGSVPSGSYEPEEAGTYLWKVSYSGDANNLSIDGVCGSNGVTLVTPNLPTIVTTPSAPFTIGDGGELSDKVDISGRKSPVNGSGPNAGKVDFRLHKMDGPMDQTCDGPVVFSDLGANLGGNDDSVTSGTFEPDRAGIYRWVANYTGDKNNAPVPGICSAANQTIVAKASPTAITTPSGPITFGSGVLSDSIQVNGRAIALPGATVDFALYGPDDPGCMGSPIFEVTGLSYGHTGAPVRSTLPVSFTPGNNDADGDPTTAGTYRWKASYSGDENNNAVSGVCSAANQTVVSKVVPTIATDESPGIALGVGNTLTGDATVNGTLQLQSGGTIEFRAYGPNDGTCANPAVFTSSNVPYTTAGAAVTSAAFQPSLPGAYRWRAFYSGDANNAPVSSLCADSEVVEVIKAVPTITTLASPGIVLGAGSLTDTATMSGEFQPLGTATITFNLYGPDNPNCTGQAIFTSQVPYPVGSPTVTSTAFTPTHAGTQAGTYRWRATYSGDAKNDTVTGACDLASETHVIARGTPTVTTVASPDIDLAAGSLTASTTVAGRVSPLAGGTITFTLFGPNDTLCTGAPVQAPQVVPYPSSGAPVVTSDPFTPNQAGTYRWTATYSGDANNTSVDGVCNASPSQNTVVGGVTATLTTKASSNIVLGSGSLSDEATVTGRANPLDGELIDFKLYGPDNANCTGAPLFESLDVPYPKSGGTVRSAAFTPTQPGTYRWVAFFGGDANNVPVDGACNDAGETVVVARNTPTLTTKPSATIVLGTGSLTDEAAVTGRVLPLGGATIDFRVFGPNDPTCAGIAVFRTLGVAYPVTGGTVVSSAFTPTKSGVYRWVAFYSGDANNAAVAGPCSDANATTVAPAPAGQRRPTPALTKQVLSRTTPKRDPRANFKFTTSGRIVLPPYCAPNAVAATVGTSCVLPICPADSTDPADCRRPSKALLCSSGKVSVRFKRLVYTMSSRLVNVRRNCTFRSTVIIKTPNPLRRGRLRVFTRFEGNVLLLPRSAAVHLVRAG